MRNAIAAFLLLLGAGMAMWIEVARAGSDTPTFNFTATEFRKKFDAQAKTDHSDVTSKCGKEKGMFVCRFDDSQFQQSVQGFKKLNLANGRFELNEKMAISSSDGKASIISMMGSRADPMSLFHFIGQVSAAIHSFNPNMSDDDLLEITKGLGLMRGDDDPTIGQPVVQIEDFAEIQCLSQDSQTTMAIACTFLPRS